MISARRSSRAVATVAAAAALSMAAVSGGAVAYGTTSDSGNPASATAATLPTGATPSATLSGTTATVSFPQASTSLASGQVSLTSYRIGRFASAGASIPVATTVCTATVAGGVATCTLTNLPGGSWWFTDTPLLAGWVGGQSAKTASPVIEAATFAISAGQTATALPATLVGGALSGFAPGESVTFGLDGPAGAALTASVAAVDAGGQASGFTLTLPAGLSAADGSHTVVAVGASSGTLSTSNSFVLGVPAALTLSGSTALGSLPGTLTAALAHFTAGENVSFHLDGGVGPALTVNGGASTNVDAVGACSALSVTVPAGIAQGNHTLYALGAGGSTAVASFTVTVAGALTFANNAVTVANPTLAGGQVTYLHAASATTFHLDSVGGTLLNVTGGSSATTVTTDLNGAASGFGVSPGGPAAQGAHTVWAVDSAGASSSYGFMLDTVAPSTIDNTAGFGAGWSTTSRTVLLTATDATSGVTKTYYTTDGSTPTAASSVYNAGTGIVLAADGTYVVKYFSLDQVGNVEAVRTSATVKIDKTAPVVSALTAGPISAPSANWVSANVGFYVYANAGDASSGLASVTADVHLITGVAGDTAVPLSGAGGPWTVNGVSYAYRSAALPVSAALVTGSNRGYTVVATDNATNTSAAQSPAPTVTVDNVGPTATDNAPVGWQRTASVTVTVTTTDVGPSGVSAVYYTTDGTVPTPANGSVGASVTFSGDGVYPLWYVVYDRAGNQSTLHKVTVQIDNTAPALTAVAAGPSSGASVGYLGQAVAATVYAAVSDPTSGLSSVTASLPAGLTTSTSVTLAALGTPVTIGGTTYNYSGTFTTKSPLAANSYTFTVTATDVAGNSSNRSGSVNTNDRTAPTNVTVTTPTSNGIYTGTFSGTAGVDQTGSGDLTTIILQITDRSTNRPVYSATVSVVNGSWTFSGPAIPSGPYTLTITQSDNAGNTTTVSGNFRV
jgi:chitobiase/beta-hexosaminidase-like protein/Big-like domain-containing protein